MSIFNYYRKASCTDFTRGLSAKCIQIYIMHLA
jgi:hypothetical protein